MELTTYIMCNFEEKIVTTHQFNWTTKTLNVILNICKTCIEIPQIHGLEVCSKPLILNKLLQLIQSELWQDAH